MLLSLKGHLFDSGLINQILDVIEQDGCGFSFEKCIFPHKSIRHTMKSLVVLKIHCDNDQCISIIEEKINQLVANIKNADAVCIRLDHKEKNMDSRHMVTNTNTTTSIKGSTRKKRVLLLGSGFVAKAFVDRLNDLNEVCITVVSNDIEQAMAVADVSTTECIAMEIDILNNTQKLSELIKESDVVVSLLPTTMHPIVAKECIVHKRNMVTASYISDELCKLEDQIKDAGIFILNEVGLDPGLDHMSAMKIIHDIQNRSGHVTSFTSVCGGLPAPDVVSNNSSNSDNINNPLRYKFSWSPIGVLRACSNTACYRRDNKLVMVPGEMLLRATEPAIAFSDLDLECIPNRNSLTYEKIYGIETASTIFRGTLRYVGFCHVMTIFQQMGLLKNDTIKERQVIPCWKDALYTLYKDKKYNTLNEFVMSCTNGDMANAKQVLEFMEWLQMINGNRRYNNQQSIIENFSKFT
jgi:alpha-aminoadipic semialdehyde synthase